MIELESIEQLDEHLANDATMEGVVVQNLDLTQRRDAVLAHNLTGTVLLGCRLDDELRAHAMASRALVFPNLDDRPFEPYRGQLYRVADLYDRFDRDRPESYGDWYVEQAIDPGALEWERVTLPLDAFWAGTRDELEARLTALGLDWGKQGSPS